MKKASAAAIVVITLASLAFWWGQRGGRDTTSLTPSQPPRSEGDSPSLLITPLQMPSPVASSETTPAPPPSPPAPTAVAGKPPAPPPRRGPPPPQDDPARQEADNIALNIRHFGQRFGGNPVGTNAEIVKTLTGDNQAKAKYLTGDLVRLNGNGELIDQWGTPYFFHANSATNMEVRSAGPDKVLHTIDDVTAR